MKLGVLLKVEKLIKTNINLANGCFWKVVAEEDFLREMFLQKFNTNAKISPREKLA